MVSISEPLEEQFRRLLTHVRLESRALIKKLLEDQVLADPSFFNRIYVRLSQLNEFTGLIVETRNSMLRRKFEKEELQ